VKISTHNQYSHGADTKYKVFWVAGCDTPPPPQDQCPDSTVKNPGDANGDGTVNAEDCDYTPPPPATCPNGDPLPTEDVNLDGVIDRLDCAEVLPTSSTAPTKKPTKRATTTPTVLPTQASSPAQAPTAVDAGLAGSGDDGSSVPSSLLILLGATMAVLGLGVGFVPIVARGKHSH
jgi:hypothetical protein